MQITQSSLGLGSGHSYHEFRRSQVSLTLRTASMDTALKLTEEAWPAAAETSPGAARLAVPLMRLSALAGDVRQQGPTTADAADAVEGRSHEVLEPRLQILVDILRRVFGREVHLFNTDELRDPDTRERIESQLTRNERGRMELHLQAREIRVERESLEFSASGSVRTADGRSIELSVEINLSRSLVEMTEIDLRASRQRLEDPLVVNLRSGSAELADTRFRFDIDVDGELESIAGLGGQSGFLALDRNASGDIDDGSELFGARSGDGFAELSALDEDDNGWIDAGDALYTRLQVWIAAGSEGEQLKTLEELGIGAVYLGRSQTPFALHNADGLAGQLRSSGIFLYEDGQAGTVQQIDLAV